MLDAVQEENIGGKLSPEEEIAVVAAVVALLTGDQSIRSKVKIREVWPEPSIWRWL